MPKSSKRRKDKAADFTKAKLKLGKGKQIAANAVDTSFTSRAIIVPSQRIGQESDLPSTRRKLTFDDLLSQLKHFNAPTRKDAILGLKELFDLHPHLLDACLVQLVNATVRLIPDEDPAVRKTLIGFYTWLMPRTLMSNFEPHSQHLLLFITSAQNHIFPEIRVDAIRFLDIFLAYIPHHITSGWDDSLTGHGTKVLKGYLGLLNVSGKFMQDNELSHISVVLTPASKLVILRSLIRFLKHAFISHHKIAHSYMVSSFADSTALHTLEGKLKASGRDESVRVWCSTPEPTDIYEDCITQDPSATLHSETLGLSDLDVAYQTNSESTLTQLQRALQSTLVSTFLDHATSVFVPSGLPAETDLDLVLAVTDLALCLYGAILSVATTDIQKRIVDDLKSLLSHMSTSFPAAPPAETDVKTEAAFRSWNLMFCELSSLFIKLMPTDFNVPWSTNVGNYVVNVLHATSQLNRRLNAGDYTSLLPTLWLLITSNRQRSSEAFQRTLDHATNLGSKSPLKLLSIEFVARAILASTEPQYQGAIQPGELPEEEMKIQAWIIHLPKVLWEVGTTNAMTSETIIRTLLCLLQRSPKYLRPQTILSMSARLVPYFSVRHQERGEVPGPFAQLPPYLRRLVLNLTGTILQIASNSDLEKAVARVT